MMDVPQKTLPLPTIKQSKTCYDGVASPKILVKASSERTMERSAGL